jgi:hypothetical protein
MLYKLALAATAVAAPRPAALVAPSPSAYLHHLQRRWGQACGGRCAAACPRTEDEVTKDSWDLKDLGAREYLSNLFSLLSFVSSEQGQSS